MRHIGLAAFCGFIGTIWAANWLIETYGIVPIGFGLAAPAGVFAAGAAFTFRDIVQRAVGRKATVVAVLVGAGLSYAISPAFAVASGVAFLVSELCDFAVYTPLERKTWLGAVTLSNTVGLVVDSALFLYLAFGSLAFIEGQIVGKLATTSLAVVLLAAARPGWRFVGERS